MEIVMSKNKVPDGIGEIKNTGIIEYKEVVTSPIQQINNINPFR